MRAVKTRGRVQMIHSFLINLYTGSSTNRSLQQHERYRGNGRRTKDSVARTVCPLERED